MKVTKYKKIIITICIVVAMFFVVNNNEIFAAINTGYVGYDDVDDHNLDKAIGNSTLLNLLAKLVYAVGRLLEWLIGIIFSYLTGSASFPWADKIVFNAVPLLDINFINPHATSFLGNADVGKVIQGLYSTILALAVAFFGIIVLVTAIKLVLSTIASEKAKYKQAIIDWLVGFVMLFCIHFGMSFIFYLNEQLVLVASEMVTAQLEDAEIYAQAAKSNFIQQIMDECNAIGAEYNEVPVAKIVEHNEKIVEAFLTLDSDDSSWGLHNAIAQENGWWFGSDDTEALKEIYPRFGMVIQWAADENLSVEQLNLFGANLIKPFRSANGYTGLAVYACDMQMLFGSARGGCPDYPYQYKAGGNGGNHYRAFVEALDLEELQADGNRQYWRPSKLITDPNTGQKYLQGQGYDDSAQTAAITSGLFEALVAKRNKWTDDVYELYAAMNLRTVEEVRELDVEEHVLMLLLADDHFENTWMWFDLLDDLIVLKRASDTATGVRIGETGEVQKTRLISDLASYFRYYAYTKELSESGIGISDSDNAQIENMLMYSILVVQSVILFIAYIKRLFYVLILAMMAPIVVVMDFFQKFGK